MRVLAGDIGGTKTELIVYDGEPGGLREVAHVRVASADHAGLLEIAAPLARDAALDAAAFGVAGPVRDGRCKTTNLPWELGESELGAALGCPTRLVNDFTAVVHGIGELGPRDLRVLQRGEREAGGAVAVLGAGTGLGMGIGVPLRGGGLLALPGEGGHQDLAPRNAREDALLAYLRAAHGGRVSLERAISGPGLLSIYRFVVESGAARESREVAAELAGADASAVVSRRGQDGSDPACVAALDLFVGLYGAAAGNLALNVLPRGGLYVAGGIAPKLIERLGRGDFIAALLDKGRMADVLARIPVAVVMQPQVGLLGARAVATGLAAG